MASHTVLRLSYRDRIVVWHVESGALSEVLQRLRDEALISRADEDLDVPQGSSILSVVGDEGSAPQQWNIEPGIEAIFAILDQPPVVNISLAPSA